MQQCRTQEASRTVLDHLDATALRTRACYDWRHAILLDDGRVADIARSKHILPCVCKSKLVNAFFQLYIACFWFLWAFVVFPDALYTPLLSGSDSAWRKHMQVIIVIHDLLYVLPVLNAYWLLCTLCKCYKKFAKVVTSKFCRRISLRMPRGTKTKSRYTGPEVVISSTAIKFHNTNKAR